MRAIRVLGLLSTFVLLCLFATSALAQKDSDEINSLLSQARTQAWQAAQDADTLQSFTNSNMAWESHAAQLRLIQDRVNALAKTTQQLNDLRSQGSQWQQAAIDKINPLLSDMNDALSATITALNNHPERVNLPTYREYAHANYDVCEGAANVISDFVAYGKSKGNSVVLREKLDLPAAGKQ
jgi:small-conductance mechanosensitive channel